MISISKRELNKLQIWQNDEMRSLLFFERDDSYNYYDFVYRKIYINRCRSHLESWSGASQFNIYYRFERTYLVSSKKFRLTTLKLIVSFRKKVIDGKFKREDNICNSRYLPRVLNHRFRSSEVVLYYIFDTCLLDIINIQDDP